MVPRLGLRAAVRSRRAAGSSIPTRKRDDRLNVVRLHDALEGGHPDDQSALATAG